MHSNPLSIKFREDEKKFDVEGFEIEDMPGVYGLKALRVEINLKSKEVKDLDNMGKIAIEAINIEI